MKLRILGFSILALGVIPYFLGLFSDYNVDFIFGILSAIGLGLALGFFSKKKTS
ncbi:MAG: hypothetical protein HKP48_08040 [Winogradskyella sp.]|uniref:hypothetical protein n=1 Tax=Winogradskyella sp. TaxID=1883156 RepID=UPI001810EBBF|nr:hypothetical protein [Winogradskyella sp.]MBT8245795.1 hypothetical protein [Winogradskyella sp.]NNK23230.1 hypothetical protein [Winogradskyella sp.]